MSWFYDSRSPLGARLRIVLLLGLVFAVVAETPLRGLGGMPSWFTLGGTGTAAGSMAPLSVPGESELAAAAKRKQNTHKADKSANDKGPNKGTDKDKADKKSKHQGRSKGKHQGGEKDKGKGKSDKKGKDTKDTPGKEKAGDGTSKSAAGITAAAATALTLAPVADAQVNEANPNYNYGTLAQILVDGGSDPDVAGYLRFDVSGVTAPVQKATLRLFVRDNGGTQNGPYVQTTGSSWSETGLTWSNRPAPSGAVLDDKGVLASSSWVEYTVTSAVKGNGAVGFVLLPQSNDGAVFHSREGANTPQLVVTLDSGTSTPTPTPAPNPTPTPTPTPPAEQSATLLAAGDIAGCSTSGDEATAKLLDGLSGTVAPLGDLAYQSGTASEFTDCYGPTWGRHKTRTRPAPGNHEYLTTGASGYFGYFGAAAGDPKKGYYSYNLGSWHVVVLNSNCSQAGGCGAGSGQEQWLRADLIANPTACTLAYWHHPRFSFGNYGNNTATQALWQALYDAGAEIVLSGHDHNYQRYAPLTPTGALDSARGIREFVVGTGGRSHYALKTPPATVEKSNSDTFGILQLTLRASSYDWKFVPEAGKSFTDTGSTACH